MRIGSNYSVAAATMFSMIVHICAMILLNNISLMPKRITPRAHLIIVDLLPAEVKPAPPPVAAPEPKKNPPQPEEKKPPVPEKKEEVTIAKPEPKPVPKPKPKPEPKPVPKKTPPKVDPEQQRQAAIARIKAQLEQKNAEEAERRESAAVAGSLLDIWKSLVDQQVRRFWVIPDTLADRRDLEAVIIMEIDKNGHLTGTTIEKSSGNPHYDQSALRAATKAAPFPPPPMGEAPVKVGLIFTP